MRIMLTGDVVGHAGRKAFCQYTPQLRREKHIDVVVVNGENSAGGKGFTRGSLDELYRGGADIVTSGNHVWDKKDVLEESRSGRRGHVHLLRVRNPEAGDPELREAGRLFVHRHRL